MSPIRGAAMLTLTTALLTVPIGAQQQGQKPANALILGRVVEATSNEPVRNATVHLVEAGQEAVDHVHVEGGGGDQPIGVMTDSDGQFLFTGLKAGSYQIRASRHGYREGLFGQHRPDDNAKPLVLRDGERLGDVTLRIWKHAAITGVVTDERGDPIVGVPVRAYARTFVAGHPRLGQSLGYGSTDDRGVYRLSRLLPGDYIVGVVRNERSAPAALIEAQQKLSAAGDRTGAGAIGEALGQVGAYVAPPGSGDSVRVGTAFVGLAPPVIAVSADGWLAYPTQFYPFVPTVSSARAIPVRSGEEITGIDLQLRPVRTVRVTGMVTDANGPVARFPVRLMPVMTSEFTMDGLAPGHATVTDDEGRFIFPSVVPGEYVVRALKGVGGGAEMWEGADVSGVEGGVMISSGNFAVVTAEGSVPNKPEPTRFGTVPVVAADRDVPNVAVTLALGAPLSGTVEFADRQDKPDPNEYRPMGVVIEAVDGRTAGFEFEMTGRVGRDGKFETVGIPPGRYFVRVPRVPEGWALEAVLLGGRDVSDRALDVGTSPVSGITIRLTQKPAVLAGSVRVPDAKPEFGNAIVLAFPTDRSQWRDYGSSPRRLLVGGVTTQGSYEIRGLPPGEYFVAAVRDDFARDWRAPAFLEAVAALASRVTIARGERASPSLTILTLPGDGR